MLKSYLSGSKLILKMLLIHIILVYTINTVEMLFLLGMQAHVSVAMISLSILFRFHNLFRKTRNGNVSWIVVALYWPYFLVNRIYVYGLDRILRWFRGESDLTKINEKFYVGGIFAEAASFANNVTGEEFGVIDLTNDYQRVDVGSVSSYLSLPLWDGVCPEFGMIDRAIRFSATKKRVFVHCCYGRGRSVMVLLALLVSEGFCKDWKEALEFVKSKRPHVSVNGSMREGLNRYFKVDL